MAHFALSRNIDPVGKLKSPCERKFKEGEFPGKRIPFMARVRFKQQPPEEKSTKSHRQAPSHVWGVFFGWELAPGGKWTGNYF